MDASKHFRCANDTSLLVFIDVFVDNLHHKQVPKRISPHGRSHVLPLIILNCPRSLVSPCEPPHTPSCRGFMIYHTGTDAVVSASKDLRSLRGYGHGWRRSIYPRFIRYCWYAHNRPQLFLSHQFGPQARMITIVSVRCRTHKQTSSWCASASPRPHRLKMSRRSGSLRCTTTAQAFPT